MGIERPHSHRTPLSAEEQRMLHAISEHTGLSAADCIRQWIRAEYGRITKRKKESDDEGI